MVICCITMIRGRKMGHENFGVCHWVLVLSLYVITGALTDKSNLGSSLLPSSTTSNASSSPLQFHSSSSSLSTLFHKLKLTSHNDSLIAQLSQSGSADLHKLLHKLKNIKSTRGGFTFESQNISMKPSAGKVLGVNKIAASIPKFITSNARLKRQLEGIFHARESTITTTISPLNVNTTPTTLPNKTPTLRFNRPTNGNVFKRIRAALGSTNNGSGHGSNPHDNRTTTTAANSNVKQENSGKEDHKIATITNFHSTKSKPLDVDSKNTPDLKGKRNFTVEIVEIARKTVITEDNKESGKYKPKPTSKRPLVVNKKTIIESNQDKENKNEKFPQHREKMEFRPIKPRLRLVGFRKLKDAKALSDSTTSASQPNKSPIKPSVRYKAKSSSTILESIPSSTTALPIPKVVENRLEIQQSPKHNTRSKPAEVKVDVAYEEQIPYNDGDVDQADLKDYLDGHSTFGAKGNFKHTVSKNISSFIPTVVTNAPPSTNVKSNNNVKKRNPVAYKHSNLVPQRSSRSRGTNDITVEQANVKQRTQNPKATVYTATGVPVLEMDDKSVYEYTGNKDKPNQFPKLLKSTLDELYRQGHPAVAKAPEPIYETHPRGEPYEAEDGRHVDYNPFKPNPLVDDVPSKFDLLSDSFYGHPRPDKDKIAQSNRPEPVQIESQGEETGPEYQEEERKRQPKPERHNENNDNGRLYYERVYEPPEYDSHDTENDRRNDDDYQDTFIKDFVSLDDNFQPLPRPSAEEESFQTLIPPEADTETDDKRFEPDRRGRQRDSDDEEDSRTTSRSRGKNERASDEDDRDSNEDDPEVPEYGEEFDQSYVDALKQFDDEIKLIQENEKQGVTSGNVPASTGEPLVITSPGPAVNYNEQRNAPRPTPMTPPTREEQMEQEEDNEDEQEEQQQEDPKPDSDSDNGNRENPDDREEETEDEGQDEREEETTPTAEDDEKVKDESIKINKVHQEKKEGKLKEDKSGNLDDDISIIDREFARRP